MKKSLFLTVFAALALGTTLWGGITVTSPNMSSEWCIDSSYTITWTSTGVTGNVDIILRLAGDEAAPPVQGIAANTANDGTEGWTVPAVVTPGTYLIRIRSVNDPAVFDDSPNFTIRNCSAAYIAVTDPPRGGWCIERNYTVRWTSSGVTGNVDVILRRAGDAAAPPVLGIAANTANDGTEGWTIPASVTAGRYLIRVRSVSDPALYDDSADFDIKNCTVEGYVLTVLDLELRGISYSPDHGGQIRGRIKNNGTGHIDQAVDIAFTLIGSRGGFAPVSKRIHLEPGEEREYDLHPLGLESMPAGGLQIRVNLDYGNHVAEMNERNNEQEARLCGLDISLQAPRSEFELKRLYMMGGEDYRIKFNVHVRHNLPQTLRNIHVVWDLIRVSSGEIVRSYDHTIAALAGGEEHTWSVNETYGKSGRDMSKRPRLTEGADYRIAARISDAHDDFCDINAGNDQQTFSFRIADMPF